MIIGPRLGDAVIPRRHTDVYCVPDLGTDHMTRYHSIASARIIAKRMIVALSISCNDIRNHYKQKPGDCGISRCHICHFDKYYQKGWDKKKTCRASLRFVEGMRELLPA